jgi:hypothetical protein
MTCVKPGGRSLAMVAVTAMFSLSGLACDDDPIDVPPTTGEIGPAGGQVEAGGAAIVVPAGALDEPVVFSIAGVDGTATIDDHVAVGPVVEILPAGTVFAVPATVRVPYDPGAIPEGANEEQVVVFTADRLDGTFDVLETSVDEGSNTASVEVSHLSVFVPAVRDPTESPPDFAPCPMHGDCDCSERDSRPLDVTGADSVDRPVHALCIDTDGSLRVTSYTPTEDPLVVGAVYDSRFDPVSLAPIDEQLVALDIDSPELCQPLEPSHLEGGDGDHVWSVRFVEREDVRTGERWSEALLSVAGGSGEITYSFNGHLNTEPPYLDTNAFYDDSNTLAGRVKRNGAASFYLNNHHEGHVDVILVDNLAAVLADPASYTDEDGLGSPDVRERFELWDDPASQRGDTYAYASLHLEENPDVESPDDDLHDRLTVFGTGRPSLIRGFEVDDVGAFVELPELGLDEFWSQFGWHNAGIHDGVLNLQSQVASFSNSVILELDTTAWEIRRQWELGCIGPPSLTGFQLIGNGVLLRFAYDALVDDVSRVMFLLDGEVLAIGDVPFATARPSFLVHPDGTRVYVAHVRTGELTAIAVP